jgi:SAM-dependent methyltransferase
VAMESYQTDTYGEQIADVYDRLYGERPGVEDVVELLAELASGGPVLELGIGTGRIALPLATRGVEVRGIDASPAMVAKLRAKPGSDAIDVTIGDFADVRTDVPLALVFVAFNTFFALLTQDDQVRCFANVARSLAPGGRFVMEAFVPDVARFDRGQRVGAVGVHVDAVQLEVSRHDQARQVVESAHVMLGSGGTRVYPVSIRYAWPSELDLMARLAGLDLEARWEDWRRTPFSSASPGHVSVWRRPPDG